MICITAGFNYIPALARRKVLGSTSLHEFEENPALPCNSIISLHTFESVRLLYLPFDMMRCDMIGELRSGSLSLF